MREDFNKMLKMVNERFKKVDERFERVEREIRYTRSRLESRLTKYL